MNEHSPSQQNLTPPVGESDPIGGAVALALANALERSYEASGLSLKGWTYKIIRHAEERFGVTLGKNTIHRAREKEGIPEIKTLFACLDYLGIRAASEVLAAINMKAVRPEDEVAALKDENATLRVFKAQVSGLCADIKDDRAKRGAA